MPPAQHSLAAPARRMAASSLALLAAACSDGDDPLDILDGGDDPDPPAAACAVEAVDAGFGRIAPAGAQVALAATVTASPSGCATIGWTQVDGPAAGLDGAAAANPTVTLPDVAATEVLTFEITVDDGAGETRADRTTVKAWVPADPGDPAALGDFSGFAEWTCDVDPVAATEVEIVDLGMETSWTINEVAAHAIGTFPNPGNPNRPSPQSATFFVPNFPEKTDTPMDMSEFGLTVDGVRLERDTAESYRNEGVWRYEALTPGFAAAEEVPTPPGVAWLGTDCNNGHVQPNGGYHYHGQMEGLVDRLTDGLAGAAPAAPILGGFAADGFPFYLRFGYADADDPQSGLAPMRASWTLKPGVRPDGPGGAYDGTFREDWEFVEGAGDLDACNGRFGPTPEYPEGVYHYYITDDYPYIPRCVFGTPDPSFRSMLPPPTGGGNPMPG